MIASAGSHTPTTSGVMRRNGCHGALNRHSEKGARSITPLGATFEGSFGKVTGRVGLRSYRESRTERLRPVIGAGVRGSYGKSTTDFRSWSTGVYGELGAVYFVAPHLSLGGTGELQASHGKYTQRSGSDSRSGTTTTAFSGSVMRLLVSVYF